MGAGRRADLDRVAFAALAVWLYHVVSHELSRYRAVLAYLARHPTAGSPPP